MKWSRPTEAYELWAKSYPRDTVPYGNLGSSTRHWGNTSKSIAETKCSQRIEATLTGYGNLAQDYIDVNSDEGRTATTPRKPIKKASMGS